MGISVRASAAGDQRVELTVDEGDVGYAQSVAGGEVALRRGKMVNDGGAVAVGFNARNASGESAVIGTDIWNGRAAGGFKLRAAEASFGNVKKAVGAEVEAARTFESILYQSGAGRKRGALSGGDEGQRKAEKVYGKDFVKKRSGKMGICVPGIVDLC